MGGRGRGEQKWGGRKRIDNDEERESEGGRGLRERER